jgi:hypothetical protein
LLAEIAEGCTLDKMVDCEVEELRARSRDDEMSGHVMWLRVRDDGMAVLKRFEILSAEEP